MSKKNSKNKRKAANKSVPPLFTAPEVLRGLAVALDTKGADRAVGKAMDEYVRKGHFIHHTQQHLLQQGILSPLSKILSSKTIGEIHQFIDNFFQMYHIEIVSRVDCVDTSRTTFGNNIILLCTPIVLDVVSRIHRPRGLPRLDELIESQSPVGAAIEWLQRCCNGWSEAVEKFQDMNYENADHTLKWVGGDSLPSLKSLVNLCGHLSEAEREQAFLLLVVARAVGKVMRSHENLHEKLKVILPAAKAGYIDQKWVHFFGPVCGKTKVDSFMGYAAFLGQARGG